MFSEDLIKYILSLKIVTQLIKNEIKITKKSFSLSDFTTATPCFAHPYGYLREIKKSISASFDKRKC